MIKLKTQSLFRPPELNLSFLCFWANVASQMPLYLQYSELVLTGWSLLSNYPTLTLTMVKSHHCQALTQGQQAWQSNLKHRKSPHHINVLLVATQAMFYIHMGFFKQAYHTSALTGHMWVTELLGGIPRCIKDQLGMDKHV